MDPKCCMKAFADGKEQSYGKKREIEKEGEVKTRQADKQADGSNSSTVL